MFNVLGGHCNVILGLRSQLRLSKCTRKSYEQRLKVTEDYFSTGEMDGKYARITVSSDGTHRLWCETASQLELLKSFGYNVLFGGLVNGYFFFCGKPSLLRQMISRFFRTITFNSRVLNYDAFLVAVNSPEKLVKKKKIFGSKKILFKKNNPTIVSGCTNQWSR